MRNFHYINGQFLSDTEATISVFDLGLLRGYGVFDYVQLYKGTPFHLQDHLKRLEWSAKQIDIALPLSLKEIESQVYSLIAKNPPIDAGIRFIVTGGISGKEQIYPKDQSSLFLLFHPFTPYQEHVYSRGMRAITTSINRLMPNVKSTNYMPAIFALREAKSKGFDDALYLNKKQEILEGTTCNAFFFQGDTLITAGPGEIVEGVTRKLFLELAKEHFQIQFRCLPLEEVALCDEAFLTSSIKDAIPLVQVNEQKIGSGSPGPQTAKLRHSFQEYVKNYLSKKGEQLCQMTPTPSPI